MLRRLRDLLAHARAGHRIGCETCAVDALAIRHFTFESDETHDGEPVVAPAPARGTDTGVPATGSQPTRRCAVCGRWDIGWNLSIHNPVETCESGCDASHHEPDWRDEPPADFGQQVFIPGPADELPQGPVGGYRESGRL